MWSFCSPPYTGTYRRATVPEFHSFCVHVVSRCVVVCGCICIAISLCIHPNQTPMVRIETNPKQQFICFSQSDDDGSCLMPTVVAFGFHNDDDKEHKATTSTSPSGLVPFLSSSDDSFVSFVR